MTRISRPYGPSILGMLRSPAFSLRSIRILSLNNSVMRESTFFEHEVAERSPLYLCGFLILCMRLKIVARVICILLTLFLGLSFYEKVKFSLKRELQKDPSLIEQIPNFMHEALK